MSSALRVLEMVCRYRMRDCGSQKKPFGLLARLRQPLDYQAIDGEPVDIVCMLLLPAFSQLEQFNAYAVVTRKLRDQDLLKRVCGASNAVELYRAITAKQGKQERKARWRRLW